jgi:hypothetical protein
VLAGCAGGVSGNDPPQIGESTGSAQTEGTQIISESTTISTSIGTTDDPTTASTSTTTDDSEAEASTADPTGADCLATWRADVPGVLVEEAALGPDGRLFVVGNDAVEGAVLLGFDRCTGELTDEIDVNLPAATSTGVYELAVDNGAIHVAGNVVPATDPGDGYVSRLEGAPLSAVFAEPLYGSVADDEIADITVDATGAIWMTGTTRTDVGPATAWVVRSDATGTACGFPWAPEGSGWGRAIVGNAGGVRVLVIDPQEEIVVLTYAEDACVCSCEPTSVGTAVAVGTATSEIGAAATIDGQIYVAGWATDTDDPDDIYAALTWLDADGELVDVYRDNATAADDGYLQLVSDGELVFAGGIDGWTGGSFENGTARLDALAVPLPTGATPMWSGAPANLDFITGLAVEAGNDGGLFVAGNAGGEGVIVRCDKTGDCG